MTYLHAFMFLNISDSVTTVQCALDVNTLLKRVSVCAAVS